MTENPVRFVLVNTTHPGNIGGVARAMKTMGLTRLRLVSPSRFPDPEANRRAAGADDLLQTASIHQSLAAAVVDCRLVIGTTARERSIAWPVLSPEQAAAQLLEEGRHGAVALVFGREASGLTNEEVELCHALARIPASAAYSSLNLASAAQLFAYVLRRAEGAVNPAPEPPQVPADGEAMRRFYQHLQEALYELDFIKVQHPPVKLMRKLVRLFNRARPTEEELNILRGILAAAQNASRRP